MQQEKKDVKFARRFYLCSKWTVNDKNENSLKNWALNSNTLKAVNEYVL